MNENDRREFVDTLTIVAATLDAELTEAKIKGFWMALSDMPIEKFKAAAQRVMRSGVMKLQPANFLDAAGMGTGREALESRAAAAWGALVGAIRRHGSFPSVRFADPAVHAVVKSLGGWIHICQTWEDADLPWKMREFEKLYRGLAPQIEAGQIGAPAKLIGEVEALNPVVDGEAPPPILIEVPGFQAPEVEHERTSITAGVGIDVGEALFNASRAGRDTVGPEDDGEDGPALEI